MAKIQPKYVQLESEAFLADFVGMSAQERGCYATIIFYLYTKHGSCAFDKSDLAALCGLSELEFDKLWRKIGKKFNTKNSKLKHKRVTKELRRAKQLIQVRSRAGVKGAQSRWQTHNKAIANENETKTKTIKVNNTNTNSKNHSLSSSTSFRFVMALETIFKSKYKSDRAALKNLASWLVSEIQKEHFDESVYQEVLEYAENSKKTARIPLAMFFHTVRRELGYNAKHYKSNK